MSEYGLNVVDDILASIKVNLNSDFSVLECDVLWKRYETGEDPICFRLITKYKNWMEAEKECQLEGGELASITSQEEHDFIIDEVKLCG